MMTKSVNGVFSMKNNKTTLVKHTGATLYCHIQTTHSVEYMKYLHIQCEDNRITKLFHSDAYKIKHSIYKRLIFYNFSKNKEKRKIFLYSVWKIHEILMDHQSSSNPPNLSILTRGRQFSVHRGSR